MSFEHQNRAHLHLWLNSFIVFFFAVHYFYDLPLSSAFGTVSHCARFARQLFNFNQACNDFRRNFSWMSVVITLRCQKFVFGSKNLSPFRGKSARKHDNDCGMTRRHMSKQTKPHIYHNGPLFVPLLLSFRTKRFICVTKVCKKLRVKIYFDQVKSINAT